TGWGEEGSKEQRMARARRSGPRWGTRWVQRLVRILPGLLASVGSVGLAAPAPEANLVLREAVHRGSTARVRIELRAQGLFRPSLPPGRAPAEARLPKPLALDVQTRLVFSERVLEVSGEETAGALRTGPSQPGGQGAGSRGRAQKVVRQVLQAAPASNGEGGPSSAVLRAAGALPVAARGTQDRPVVVVSPAGPLTRSELELVQALGDPLTLADLLPDQPVGVGRSWRVGDPAAQALSGYDRLTSNGLSAVLESCDVNKARVRLT